MVFGDKLIPSLVLLYCVPILFGDVFLETDSCLHGFQVYGFETSVHLILKHAEHCPKCGWTIHVPLHFLCDEMQVITGGYVHQLLYALVDIKHDLVLPHGLVRVSMEGILCVHTMASRLLNNHA